MTPPAPSMLAGRATSRTTCGWRGRSSSASSTTDHPLPRVDRAEQRGEDRGLAAAGAPGDEERQPGGQHRAQQRLAGRRRRVPSARSAARSWAAGRSTRSDRQVPSAATGGSTACSRTPASASQPSTYGLASSSRRPAATASRWASRRTAASSGKRSRWAPGRRRGRPTPRRAADQDVGGARVAQQLVERPGADELLAQHAQRGQHVEVGGDPAGLGAHRGGRHGGRGVPSVAASRTDAVDQPRSRTGWSTGPGHAASSARLRRSADTRVRRRGRLDDRSR